MTEKKEVNKSVGEEVEPLISETPTVVIEGKEYKMKRLGMVHTFKLARIVASGAAGIGKDINSLEMNAESVIGLLIVGFPYADKLICSLFADVLGVKIEDIMNPNLFPMGSEVDIIRALVKHIDVKAFFIKLTELMKMSVWKEFSKGTLTSSKKDTDGQTKK